MFAPLRQRNFALLWFGQLISLIGDWLLFVALPFYIYTITGSTLATGIMFIIQTLPRVFLSSVAGVFVDRWSRKKTMLFANLIQAVALLPLLLMHSANMIWIVYICAFVDSCVAQFFLPASNAIIPNLVDKEQLLSANALNSMSQELTRLVGPLLGGVLVGLFGIGSVVLVDSVSFLFAAFMIALITVSVQPVKDQESTAQAASVSSGVAGLSTLWHEWLDGLRLIRRDKLLRAIFLALGVSMIAEGILQVILAPWVKTVLHGTTLTFGWIATVQAIGGLIGSLLIPRISKIIAPARLIPISGMLVGLLVFAIVNVHNFLFVLILVGCVGVVVIGFFVTLFTMLQEGADDAYRGRIFGAFGVVQAVTMLLGMGLASTLGDAIGIVPVLDIAAGCDFVAGLLAFLVVLHKKPQVITPEQAQAVTGDMLKREQAVL